ncbi:MAG: hypothetical protein D3916_08705 [Candidatus Electrothrix sp. MAN1_4]|nr:hypothetical protein [Candidatus Electrothrix sp. MAN1_4]
MKELFRSDYLLHVFPLMPITGGRDMYRLAFIQIIIQLRKRLLKDVLAFGMERYPSDGASVPQHRQPHQSSLHHAVL